MGEGETAANSRAPDARAGWREGANKKNAKSLEKRILTRVFYEQS